MLKYFIKIVEIFLRIGYYYKARGNFYMKAKTGLDVFNKILAVILVISIIALIAICGFVKRGGAAAAPVNEDNTSTEDVATIEEFKPATYGGKEFKTVDDVVNYYVECYNYTKTLGETYTYEGSPTTMYKLVGSENIEVKNLLVEGKSISMIDQLVPGILGSLFTGGIKGLPPSGSLVPGNDTVTDQKIDVSKSLLTPEDVLMANVKDNGDGTISVTIQPKAVTLSMPAQDAQGHFFNTLGDISSVVGSISVLSFSSGTIEENFVVDYKGGTGTVTINTATNEIVSAEYTMLVHINVQHANVLSFKDKKASLDIVYTNSFPASNDYLAERNCTKG